MSLTKVKEYQQYKESYIIFRFSALGDVMCVFPLLYTLAKTYPEYLFFFVTKEPFVSPFTLLPDNVVTIGVDTQREYRGLKGCYRLAKYLRKIILHSAFHIVDLHNVLRSVILRNVLQTMGAQKIGIVSKNRNARKAFLRDTQNNWLPTVWERYQKACSDVGIPLTTLLTPDYRALFLAHHPTFDPSLYIDVAQSFLLVAPFAAHSTKMYPADLMERFLKMASSTLKIYVVGKGKKEQLLLKEWKTNLPPNTFEDNFSWNISLAEEVFCYTYARVALVMDSANLHLCGMAAVPTLSLWGGTSPMAGFNVWQQQIPCVGGLDLYCHPCSIYGRSTCKRKEEPFLCMRQISPEILIEKIKNIYSNGN